MKTAEVLSKYLVLIIVSLSVVSCAYKNPRTHDDMVRYGVRLAEKGYWREAGMQWRMVLNEDPDNVAALNNLGVAAEVLEGSGKAYTLIRKAQSLRPDSGQIQYNLKSLEKRSRDQSSREESDADKKRK